MLGRQKVSYPPTGWLSSHRGIFGAKNLNTTITLAIEYFDLLNDLILSEKASPAGPAPITAILMTLNCFTKNYYKDTMPPIQYIFRAYLMKI